MEDDLDCRKEEMKESQKKRKLSGKLINKMKLTKVKKTYKIERRKESK